MGSRSKRARDRERTKHQDEVAQRSAYVQNKSEGRDGTTEGPTGTSTKTPAKAPTDDATSIPPAARNVASGTIAVLSIVGLFITDLPILARASAVVCVTAAVALVYVRGRLRLLLAAVLVAVATVGIVAVVAARPSEDERIVSQYVNETLEANIWVTGEPTGYPRSEQFMVDHFEAFDPRHSHSWEELADPTGVALPSVIQEASLLSGRPIAFAGTVNGSNQFGNGEFIVQIIPLWPEDSEAMRGSPIARRMLPDLDDVEAFSNAGITDPHASRKIVYVRITPRNFVFPQPGDVWLVNGVTLAYGRTLRGDGNLADVAYVAGSSMEHFDSLHDAGS